MDNDFRIFLVDDDPLIRELIGCLIGEHCQLEQFADAESCRTRLQAQKPDLILLDIVMPGINGHQFCRQIKDDFETQDIHVIFISGHDSPDDRFECYEAGGDDFITKPFQPEELLAKISVARRIISDKARLRSQANYAREAAMVAISTMGEQGSLISFLSRSFNCNDLFSLASAMLETLEGLELRGAVQLQIGSEVLTLSPNGQNVPLEVSVINNVKTAGSIFQFKTRCVFNYGGVSLLINNMPIDDADRCGRIRDNGALLAEGADARRKALELEQLNHQRYETIIKALPRVNTALESLRTNYHRSCHELTELMIKYQDEQLTAFAALGLSDAQEQQLSDLAQEYMNRMLTSQDASQATVTELEHIADLLGSVTQKN